MSKILLNSGRYADAELKNVSTRISLANDKNVLDDKHYNEIINEYNVYLDERESCNTIRLTADVNIIASNVLFNHITEIVKNEDSSDVKCLNFEPVTISSTIGKSQSFRWGVRGDGNGFTECLRDTQISYSGKNDKDYVYHCGLDIFNNHILRSKSKAICRYVENMSTTSYFNTIRDVARNDFGNVKYHNYTPMHLYKKHEILSFEECIQQKLKDRNGWLGFINTSTMNNADSDNNEIGISRVLNNESVGDFIELYPGKSYYDIMPYYNKSRKRYEKNWEYCLTYPYSATTHNIPCINESLKTIKIVAINENELDDDDLQKTIVYSSCRHGLNVDDTIIIYRSRVSDDSISEVVESDIIVDSIIDDYTFVVYVNEPICKNWVSIYDTDELSGGTHPFITFPVKPTDVNHYKYGSGQRDYVLPIGEYVNADMDNDDEIGSYNLSFAKLVGGQQCEYYMRLFARFPNFEFMNDEITEENIYTKQTNGKLNVEEFSKLKYEKYSELNKLAFSQNIYSDTIGQIVYVDDINIDKLHDNLGRPLTSLYLSFFKTNNGYNEWYNEDITNNNIEHSHCFGKLNCGIKYNPNIFDPKFEDTNICYMNNVYHIQGLSQVHLRENATLGIDSDEIIYTNQNLFYGDICEYSESQCYERTIDVTYNRFNTAQRELSSIVHNSSFEDDIYFMFDSIENDDSTNFYVDSREYETRPCIQPEGYYYKVHYEIPIRTFSDTIKRFSQKQYHINKIDKQGDLYIVTTVLPHYFDKSDEIYIYDLINKKTINCKLQNILSHNTLTCNLSDVVDCNNVENYRIYNKPKYIPSYVNLSKDGSGEYRWRNICQNGFEEISNKIEEYPYTNGCLYINKKINLFVRRQDPFSIFGLANNLDMALLQGQASPIENYQYSSDSNNGSGDENNSSINEKSAVC